MTTRMLVWSDYGCSTGFSNVMSNILRRLPADDFEIDVIGIGFAGDPTYDKSRFPGRIWPCITSLEKPFNDMYGRQKFIDRVIWQDYDVIFVLQDTPVAAEVFPLLLETKAKYGRGFKLVYYFPIDSPPRAGWLHKSVALADIPVAYTEYGATACRLALPGIDSKLRVIPHGVDLDDFSCSANEVAEYRESLCVGAEDGIILGNINRNQPRKDIHRSLLLLHELRKTRDDFYLYLHMSNKDVGGHLAPAANQLGLFEGVDYFLPPNFDSDGYEVDRLNVIYNMIDILITTSLGEGWGLCLDSKTLVRTNNGYVNIEDLEIGNKVLTRNGFRNIVGKKSRLYTGKVIKITVSGRSINDPLILTPEHKVLTKNGWKEAKLLEHDDIILLASTSFEGYKRKAFDLVDFCNTKDWCRSERYIWQHGSYKKNLSRKIYVNKNFAELYGIYLAEGNVRKDSINFSVSQDETDLTNRIVYLVEKVWGSVGVSIRDDSKSKKRWIEVSGKALSIFYSEVAGNGAHNKHISIINILTKHTASKVLKGIWMGDGSREKYGYEITTVSRQLAYDIVCLGEMLGMDWTVEFHIKRRAYRVRCKGSSAYKMSLILDEQEFQFAKYGLPQYPNESYIKDISIDENYSGEVFDIQVEDEHEFLTHHGIVHNSLTEAMATRTPVIGPDHTAISEILADGRGILVPAGHNSTLWMTINGDSGVLRPIVDVEIMAEKVLEMVTDIENNNTRQVKQMTNKAYRWVVKTLDWNKLVKEHWLEILSSE